VETLQLSAYKFGLDGMADDATSAADGSYKMNV